MKRLLWLGLGIGVGVLVVRQITKMAHAYTPQGIAETAQETAGGLVESVRSFVDDVRIAMAEREQEIHAAFADGVLYEDQFAEERGYSLDGIDTEEGPRR